METEKQILFNPELHLEICKILQCDKPSQLRSYILSLEQIKQDLVLKNMIYQFIVPCNEDMKKKYEGEPEKQEQNLLEFFQMWQLQDHFNYIELTSNLPINVILHGKIPSNIKQNQRESFADFYVFYQKVFVEKNQQNFVIGYNNTLIPQKKHGKEQFGRLYNSYHALMDLKFSKDFEKLFMCQGCNGSHYKPALFYIVTDKNIPFCGCILCETCCLETSNQQECPSCFRVNYKCVLSNLPVTAYYKLDFEKIENLEKKIEENPEFVAEYIKHKMRKEAYSINGKPLNDVYMAKNVTEESLTSLTDFITIIQLFEQMRSYYDDLVVQWNSFENKTEILGQKLFHFTNELCLKYYELLCNNGLVSSKEMSDVSTFVLPQNDRENQEKYKQVEKNVDMWTHSLIYRVYNELLKMQCVKKNSSLSFYGVDQLYDKHILIQKQE